MNAKELMIGDWLNAKVQVDDTGTEPVYENFRRRVTRIDIIGHSVDFYLEDGMNFGADISPIPITPDILEQNGFVREEVTYAPCLYILYTPCSPGYRPHPQKSAYVSIYSNGNIVVDIVYQVNNGGFKKFSGACSYVHELQHALRICGIEKEIVL